MSAVARTPVLHPTFVAAAGVLALNDHVLKWAYGTWSTGKLSDVAGVLLLPLLLVGLARAVPAARRPAGRPPHAVDVAAIAVTAVGFTLVKTVPVVDRAYEVAVGSIRWVARSALAPWIGEPAVWRPIIVTPDPTALLVLPVLAGSWWVLRRCRRVVSDPAPILGTEDRAGAVSAYERTS